MPTLSLRHPTPGLILPDGWDTAWRAAKANSATSAATVSLIGDSISIGSYATDIMLTTYWAKLRAQLTAAYTLGADFYSFAYSSAIGGLYNYSMATPPVVLHGVTSTNWLAYFCGYNYGIFNAASGGQTPMVAVTPPYNVVGFDIVYIDYNSGTFTYNVDGGSNTTVTSTGNNTSPNAIVKKASVTGLTSGSHTLNINSGSTVNTCNILGVACYANQSTGIRFVNHAWSGMGLNNSPTAHNFLADTTMFPVDRLALHQGYQGTTASPSSLTGFGFPTQPDLAILAMGVNDIQASVTAGTFEDWIRRAVQVLRYGKNDACSILILGMYLPNTDAPGSTTFVRASDMTSTPYTGMMELYDSMRNVALEYNCAYGAVHTQFGQQPATNGWVTSASNLHPTDAGHTRIYNMLASAI
jgi:hypothetical protein